jgi:hypothetical protein
VATSGFRRNKGSDAEAALSTQAVILPSFPDVSNAISEDGHIAQ